MPTAVGSARQCLAGDAAAALDAAVSVARRLAHAQTTSLHVVFALLSTSSRTTSPPPSSLLRDALSRARSSAYSPRLQFKALELCFSVALDRLPSASGGGGAAAADEPPVSNSLMAAIKRSQANQRRHPDTFHFYQQQQLMMTSSSSPTSSPSTSSFSGVKVELQQLVLAILDDPVVSRVFGEAGFCSPDIKLAVLRPPPPILRFPRASRCPPMFLCNFSAAPAGEFSDNCRRIGEILARNTAHNPMLVGGGAAAAAADFAATLERQNWAAVPLEIAGLRYVGVEGRVPDAGLEELGRKAEKPGVVVGIGDLKGLVELGKEVASSLVSEMTRVLDLYRGRVSVMGWSATYETYMEFLSKFPMLDRDWDLQLLPITPPKAGGFLARPQSLMESFVPFGGFFATTYESPSPIPKSYPSNPRCQNCNDRYEQELATIMKDRSPPLEDQNQTNFPSWLRKVDLSTSPNTTKAKDDDKLLNARVVDLQKKWNDHCQQLHHNLSKFETNRGRVLPPVIGLPFISAKDIHEKGLHPAVSQSPNGIGSALPISVASQKIPPASLSISLPVVSEPTDKDLISKLQARVSKSEQLQTTGFQSHQSAVSSYLGSPSSVASVTTDLVLGTPHEPTALGWRNECSNGSPRCSPINKVNEFQRQISLDSKIDTSDFKSFYTCFLEKVGRQKEAIWAISQAIIDCKNGNGRHRGAGLRGDIWLSFHGPDRLGKKRAASALAELVLGSRERLICIDLGYQESVGRTNAICDRDEVNQRGKTLPDRVAAEISKKPFSVVFLENIEKAEPPVQDSLLQAIRTGKFPHSYGRQLNIHNTIFIVTSKNLRGKIPSPKKEVTRFPEEMILAAKEWQMKILVEPSSDTMCRTRHCKVSISSMQESSNQKIVGKRKIDVSEYSGMKRGHKIPTSLLDLNLPVEEVAEEDTDCSSINRDEAWAEEILSLMDETVNFKPFDFDALADSVLKQISKRLWDAIGCECSMEIDAKVMQQILASSWLLEDTRDLDIWLNEVLCRSFRELRQRRSNKFSTRTVLKLIALEEPLKDEYALGLPLPSRIILD